MREVRPAVRDVTNARQHMPLTAQGHCANFLLCSVPSAHVNTLLTHVVTHGSTHPVSLQTSDESAGRHQIGMKGLLTPPRTQPRPRQRNGMQCSRCQRQQQQQEHQQQQQQRRLEREAANTANCTSTLKPDSKPGLQGDRCTHLHALRSPWYLSASSKKADIISPLIHHHKLKANIAHQSQLHTRGRSHCRHL